MPPLARPTTLCASCAHRLHATTASTNTRAFTTTPSHSSAPSPDLPRWQQTPPRMRMPFGLRPKPLGPVWRVNDKQEPLDEMYDRLIGRVGESAAKEQGLKGSRGRDMLAEDVKWLAITHKSFDHGRQGFNDRLAFLGKRILDLQTSLALLRHPPSPANPTTATPPAPTLPPTYLHLSPPRIAALAQTYGLDKVVRWKPKKAVNLKGSGLETVLAHTVCSVIGALALQRGGEVAARVVRERVLGPLGVK